MSRGRRNLCPSPSCHVPFAFHCVAFAAPLFFPCVSVPEVESIETAFGHRGLRRSRAGQWCLHCEIERACSRLICNDKSLCLCACTAQDDIARVRLCHPTGPTLPFPRHGIQHASFLRVDVRPTGRRDIISEVEPLGSIHFCLTGRGSGIDLCARRRCSGGQRTTQTNGIVVLSTAVSARKIRHGKRTDRRGKKKTTTTNRHDETQEGRNDDG